MAQSGSPRSNALLLASSKPAVGAHLSLIALTLLSHFVPIPANVNVVITAALAVYAGSWRSVKPELPEEAMSHSDAMRFPIVGSCVLLSLFLMFKFLPAWAVNMVLTAYISIAAVTALAAAALPFVEDYFPKKLQDTHLTLPKIKIPHVLDTKTEPVQLSVPQIAVGAASMGFCAWYVTKRHWLANNLIGIAFSLEGIEFISLGSVQVGCILLAGLFFYDIFWVFCTPVMVSVAKNFDAPIKLLFPRGIDAETGKRAFSMLGLGDIVIPGLFVALMLRRDAHNNFAGQYFTTAFVGYVLGLGATIVVMNVFNAAQPALLYIVPAVLGCVGAHAWARGELMQVYHYNEQGEEHTEASKEADAAEPKKDK